MDSAPEINKNHIDRALYQLMKGPFSKYLKEIFETLGHTIDYVDPVNGFPENKLNDMIQGGAIHISRIISSRGITTEV